MGKRQALTKQGTMMLKFKEHLPLYTLMLASFIIRGIAAAFTGLGNDEVYYWTYAVYPDWSHFDHPPMVGYMIQLFSADLALKSEFFMRLSSVVFGTINTYLIYLIGKSAGGKSSGFIAALLYTASIYCTVIAGIFIMPDTPLLPLWLSCIWLGIHIITAENAASKNNLYMVLFGLCAGLAIISKYHAVFLWFGLMLFILLKRRFWLKSPSLYLAIIISVICILPVLIWNINNDFISFKFQGERVSVFEQGWRPDYFATEFFGQVFYNNPFNFILIVLSIFTLFRKGFSSMEDWQKYLMYTALPLIGVILFFSLFRRTLPHWSGPAYTTLIPLAAFYISHSVKKWHFKMVSWAVGLAFIFLSLGIIEINIGVFSNSLVRQSADKFQKGKYDVTLDMYGWDQLAGAFVAIRERDVEQNKMEENSPIVDRRWFTAAHIDYYLASPNNINLFAFGSMTDIHKYAWINNYRGNLNEGQDAYYIAHSRSYSPPDYFSNYFQSIESEDTISVLRGGKTVAYFFVYRLKNYKGNFVNPLKEFDVE